MTDTVRVELEQGTDEWLAWRRRKFTASDAAIAMGLAPKWWSVNSVEHMLQIKAGAEPPKDSEFTKNLKQGGHIMEALQREAGVEPACFERGEYAASLDGLDEAFGAWYEIKGPRDCNSSTYKMALEEGSWSSRIPPYIFSQLAHQAYVLDPLGLETCYYIVAPADGSEPVKMAIDAAYLYGYWPAVEKSWGLVREAQEEMASRDQAKDDITAQHYLAALDHYNIAKNLLANAKDKLLEGGSRRIGNLVAITETEVAGTVDWKKAAVAAGVVDEEAEKFRKPGTTRVNIKVLEGGK